MVRQTSNHKKMSYSELLESLQSQSKTGTINQGLPNPSQTIDSLKEKHQGITNSVAREIASPAMHSVQNLSKESTDLPRSFTDTVSKEVKNETIKVDTGKSAVT